jgi:hypothetical protein
MGIRNALMGRLKHHTLKFFAFWMPSSENPDPLLENVLNVFPDLELVSTFSADVIEVSNCKSLTSQVSNFFKRSHLPSKLVFSVWENGTTTYLFPPQMDSKAQAEFVVRIEKSRQILGYTVFNG